VNGKPPHQLWAEAVRDVGVLFAVFGPLDTIYASQPNWRVALALFLAGMATLYIGILMESDK